MRPVLGLLLLSASVLVLGDHPSLRSSLASADTLTYSSYKPSSRSQPSPTKVSTIKGPERHADEYSRATDLFSSVRLSATSAHYSPVNANDDTDDEQATLPERSDAAIVQNNYNVKMSATRSGITRNDSALWTIIVGLLVVILVMGIILLATIWKLVVAMGDDASKRHHPMIVMPPPPGANIKWAHDPIYEMPQGYQTGGESPGEPRHFRDNELYPPKYE